MNYENIFLSEEEIQQQIEIENIKKNGLEGLTLLTREQIESLDVFKKYGLSVVISDFAILLGGLCIPKYFSDEGRYNRIGCWWTKSLYEDINQVFSINAIGVEGIDSVSSRISGIRPAIPFSSISKICKNKVSLNGLIQVEYGEYPQEVCSKELSEELGQLYLDKKLNKTGKSYITDSSNCNESDKGFEPQGHIEYEYNGKKYVKVLVNSCYDILSIMLSDGEKYKDGDFVWIEVSPIKWLVDEESDIAITKNIIVAGIQFNNESNYTGDNFDEMNIKKFLDNYLSYDIIPSEFYYKTNNETKEELEPQTLEEALKQAKEEMNEILNSESFQKIKRV